MKRILLIKLILIFALWFSYSFIILAQDELKPSDKIVYVVFENRFTNFVLIPNRGKLPYFKIYRKHKTETDFTYIGELEKPSFADRNECGYSYGVCWEDPKYHSRDVDYKVLALDKKGIELCEMIIIWEKEKELIRSNDSLKNH